MADSPSRPRVIVGISGASGFQYGVKVLQLLRDMQVETHLVMSRAAGLTRQHETGWDRGSVEALADICHPSGAVDAPIASGSFLTQGMIVAPCSMRTLAAIANGISDSLLTRAADVCLKERRRLVLMARETPLHLGHLRHMAAVTEYGAMVFPPVPAMYAMPESIDAMITHSAARAISLLGLQHPAMPRWGGDPELPSG
ncbi:UbiX family flavin prenyltransferase [Frateuria aurantia]|uniref:Flavin prenyltransferase UbiX n=1 Tax=Frateuria aurantia (strain ATCC 33424 / DSM 6220 / KCTC 2777 / LMG 1558 / NBRC 3245 / NCIMB 13370) TaxID=767434 RepID=H8L448_FRAAD|nr:UbiX family flavin prenyltransferase [Frateuria aurantia]AFC86524.1 polyprenyl p-hydroxybenzoate/phenylacrylic acid decarboxylase [Frateuria aurantia DSM 6220]